jgi:hypothetical protein
MADPFGFCWENKRYIVFEQFGRRLKQGSILSMEYCGGQKTGEKSLVFKDQNHMSYPYVFTQENSLFLTKEDSSLCNIELFRLKGMEPVETITLVEGFRAVDPSLVYYNGIWWLFCTNGDSLDCELLYIFYSDMLDGVWKAHENNPVKRDISCARPAGTPFIHNGVLYRPGQDNSEEYGKRIVISKVIELSPVSFREEVSYIIEADKAKVYCDGTHTISKFGDLTLVDARLKIPIKNLKSRNLNEQ